MSVHDYGYSQSRTLPADYDDSARSRPFNSICYDDDNNDSRQSQQVVVIRRKAPPPVIPEGYRIVQNPTQALVRRSPSPSGSGNGQLVVRRRGPTRRASSLDRASFDGRGAGRGREEYRRRRYVRERRDDSSASSSSSSSSNNNKKKQRSRRRRPRDRGAKSNASRRRSHSKSEKEEHTSASEMSSSAEEKELKKVKRKEILTGLFATVATIHAAAQVHSTVKARDERKIAESKGEITAEESKKLGNNAKMKQLAAVGIAAIGIKSAIDEVKEAREIHGEMRERVEARERHHEKRQQKARSKSTNR